TTDKAEDKKKKQTENLETLKKKAGIGIGSLTVPYRNAEISISVALVPQILTKDGGRKPELLVEPIRLVLSEQSPKNTKKQMIFFRSEPFRRFVYAYQIYRQEKRLPSEEETL
ncbi:MAG: hypothetical protein J6Z35_10455, partial [Lachnospiraceae bacterium]|nr:hypothetical protein [Lachnospiraceae bacterium]